MNMRGLYHTECVPFLILRLHVPDFPTHLDDQLRWNGTRVCPPKKNRKTELAFLGKIEASFVNCFWLVVMFFHLAKLYLPLLGQVSTR